MEAMKRQRRKMQSVTMMDVAERADVSPSTVSLYLRKPDAVSAAASRAIAEAIDALKYVPNLMAGGLAAASSRAVSVIVPSVRNAFFAETVASMQTELGKERLQVMLGHSEYSEREEENLVKMALSWKPAAIVLTGLSHTATTRRLLRDSNVPVVELWELGGEPIDMAVGFYHEQVGSTAATHLVQRGRKRLIYIGARLQEDRRAAFRADGFIQAAREAEGVSAEIVEHPAPASAAIGAMLLAEAIKRYPDADAIACSNDHIALGVIFECQRIGIAIPERLSVIGFGDLSFSSACNPALTTIRPPGDLIGTEAARLILERMNGTVRPKSYVIDTRFTLLQRQSS
ncbi:MULTISPECIES: LacI family DNA-binding transcriptional regulator [unclassified Rhizobium]|uniref:LacI family DNA-binding transcriptional regulator n=1 Tax=unclassified Rhizobium TaxID=2613769 RepID=UPI00216A15A5|nr:MULTISPECIES: LacI family DNA-binding transcriptional regulator [unclassified Rhizobium]MCS3742060.1 LacI family gluconate utilization system Gnt-I transcriptional repressor [Rhizobium sp. BK661]MCS4093971.1 LacI family gluconate utilization system Gnt-I transcriptional repressor [Rhizobium sp. BK176]